MFTSKEKTLLELTYFKSILCATDVCELESKNGDRWLILKVQNYVPKHKLSNVKDFDYTYQLYHRHKEADGFHLQTEYINLLDVILEIIAHDDYRLKNKGKTYFDTVVSIYANPQATA